MPLADRRPPTGYTRHSFDTLSLLFVTGDEFGQGRNTEASVTKNPRTGSIRTNRASHDSAGIDGSSMYAAESQIVTIAFPNVSSA